MTDDRPTGACIPLEELGAVLERDRDDPRRAHVEECPRCRSLAIELRAFLAGAERLPRRDIEAAELRLGAALRREILGEDRVVRVPASRWRPVLAAAAVLVVAILSVWILDRPASDGTTLLRGEPAAHEGGFRGQPTAAILNDGGTPRVDFRWQPQEGAEGYRLHLYTAELRSLATLETAETTLSWRPSDLAEPPPPGAVLAWRVAVLRHGEESILSPIRTLRLP